MSVNSRSKSFEDLKVFQGAQNLAVRIYQTTKEDPFRKDFGLTHQIQKATVSILSNIAEGFERGSNTEFIQFLYIAKGSCGEVRAQLILAYRLRYLSDESFEELTTSCKSLSGMIFNLVEYLKRSGYPGHKYKNRS